MLLGNPSVGGKVCLNKEKIKFARIAQHLLPRADGELLWQLKSRGSGHTAQPDLVPLP